MDCARPNAKSTTFQCTGYFRSPSFFVSFSENQLVGKMRSLSPMYECVLTESADTFSKTRDTSYQTLASLRMALFAVNSPHWAPLHLAAARQHCVAGCSEGLSLDLSIFGWTTLLRLDVYTNMKFW